MKAPPATALGIALAPLAPGLVPEALELDGRYRGVYVLMEKPEVGRRKIDAGGQGQLYEMTDDGRSAPGTVSTYAHRRPQGRLVLGPIWDFDVAMGNASSGPARSAQGWIGIQRPWAERLYADRGFARRFARRWERLRDRGLLGRMLAAVDRRAAGLGDARQRNFERWPLAAASRPTYEAEVRMLTDWLRARAAWMDANVRTLRRAARRAR